MKKEALEIVRKIFQILKWEIPHPNLEEIFNASVAQAMYLCNVLAEENPDKKEKYEALEKEIKKLTFQSM